jgi:hypothetical protein
MNENTIEGKLKVEQGLRRDLELIQNSRSKL